MAQRTNKTRGKKLANLRPKTGKKFDGGAIRGGRAAGDQGYMEYKFVNTQVSDIQQGVRGDAYGWGDV